MQKSIEFKALQIMSIIEQATKRLEELRRAGIDIPLTPGEKSANHRIEPAMGSSVAPPVRIEVRKEGAERNIEPARLAPTSANKARSQHRDINLPRLAGEGYLTPDAPGLELVEELRAVKRPIIEHANDIRIAGRTNGNLILVTSALPGEGKTFCAINLAISIAMEVDRSVLLVDADVVRPSVMARLGIEDAELGMLDVLTKPSLDLSDVLIRTNIPKLTLLPAGSATVKSTELLASDAMERLLAELAVRYADRIVIFDGPPLLATSESRVLASRMGQVLMVVEANKTAQTSVKEAFASVENCETVWCILNKSTSERASVAYERQAYRKG